MASLPRLHIEDSATPKDIARVIGSVDIAPGSPTDSVEVAEGEAMKVGFAQTEVVELDSDMQGTETPNMEHKHL